MKTEELHCNVSVTSNLNSPFVSIQTPLNGSHIKVGD